MTAKVTKKSHVMIHAYLGGTQNLAFCCLSIINLFHFLLQLMLRPLLEEVMGGFSYRGRSHVPIIPLPPLVSLSIRACTWLSTCVTILASNIILVPMIRLQNTFPWHQLVCLFVYPILSMSQLLCPLGLYMTFQSVWFIGEYYFFQDTNKPPNQIVIAIY